MDVDLEKEQIKLSEAATRIKELAARQYPGHDSYQIEEWEIMSSEATNEPTN